MSLQWLNLGEFFSAVEDGAKDLERQAQDALTELGDAIANRERSRAPKPPQGEATGRGAESITSVASGAGSGFMVEVGPDAFYFGYYEFGDSRQPARPFMRPAIEEAIAGW